MAYEVTVLSVPAKRTAVVRATITWEQLPTVWPELSGEVWACLRAGGVDRGCPNIMLYRDSGDAGRPVDVEIGVELRRPCPLTGRVVASTLPAGEIVTTVHRGPYSGLGGAYRALVEWCAEHGRERSATRWELYGPHRDDPAELTTEVSWLLAG